MAYFPLFGGKLLALDVVSKVYRGYEIVLRGYSETLTNLSRRCTFNVLNRRRMNSQTAKTKTVRPVPLCKTSPFKTERRAQTLVVYQPGGYQVSLLMSLSAPALRCWLFLASELNPDGSSSATLSAIRKRTGHPLPTLSRGIRQLIESGLIAKKSGVGDYWMNPAYVYTLNLLPD